MRNAWVFAVLVACGGGETADEQVPDRKSPRRIHVVTAKVKELSLQMCACKDAACADRIQNEYTAWSTEMGRSARPEDTKDNSAAELKALGDATVTLSNCYVKARDPNEHALARIGEGKQAMCACKDKACGDQVMKELAAWSEEFERGRPGQPTAEQDRKGERIVADMAACRAKLQ